ncbi:hypothetical protein BDA96_05G158600 [Sorghum bicolor]|jgi:hypothetical protein|uniref:Wall-associated receptor kinase galacturonan-binding domain-containing protein n=1 Tax=Sorghum bicolor TaxID=4558 RepID=A0A921QYB1_SORBI|nr:hypothetical protein BDA96_05G158600 [Sorghum bicolor]
MPPWSSSLLLLLAAIAAMLALQLRVATAAPPVQIPGCRTSSCGGNVSLPYPFSINANCSIPGFNDLTCDRTTDSSSRLLLINEGSAGLQVTSIHLRKATIYAANCAIQSMCLISGHHQMGRSHLPFEGWDDPGSYLDEMMGSLLFFFWLVG